MPIRVVPLGAGQDVGRSCVLVTVGGKNIMFDCGMHMGYNDERRFPDFTYISKTGRFTEALDAVIISHFHLDHCGALPFFTEMCGYDGPIYMTHPTKAICPILLEDYRKITVERKGETNFFTSNMIKQCMKKVVPISLHQTIHVDDELEIKAYYAGHVLGAAMFYVRSGNESVVYTGDYNMTPDRHLGSAWIDKVRPDVLITESTYGTTIRDSKRSRERDFLRKVHDCVQNGGKVIIPVFALGRAQELCILIESYWERMALDVPIYFSAGLTERANQYYKLFINWTNQKIRSTFVQRNMFDFKHIRAWSPNYADLPGPMVLFATPGMLHMGTSLEVFKKWAPDPKNMVIMPGYCVAGTVGAKVLQGQKLIEIDMFTKIQVNLQVRNLSFSAHADAKGIMQLIRHCEPRHVVLVHGEKSSMDFLKGKIIKEFNIPCLNPANGVSIRIETRTALEARLSTQLLKSHLVADAQRRMQQFTNKTDTTEPSNGQLAPHGIGPHTNIPIRGVLLMKTDGGVNHQRRDDHNVEIIPPDQFLAEHHGSAGRLYFQSDKEFSPELWSDGTLDIQAVYQRIMSRLHTEVVNAVQDTSDMQCSSVDLRIRSVTVTFPKDKPHALRIRWAYEDEQLANTLLAAASLALYPLA